jgi:hypothetical protein
MALRKNSGRTSAASPRRRRELRGFEPLEDRRLLAVVINEFHYDPDIATEQVEFIELHNTGPGSVDLSGWRIDEAVDYAFPGGASIAEGGYVVITQNTAEYLTKFGVAAFGQWETGDRLSNEGETIELLDAGGAVIDTVTYKPGFPWPTTGDFGTSLELINPNLDNDLGGSWRSSGYSAQSTNPVTLVANNSVWNYRKGITQNPPANWRLNNFNTATDVVAWQPGGTPIGYGTTGISTTLGDMRQTGPNPGYPSVYLRQNFTVGDSVPNTLKLRVNVDDGVIIWINGFEVTRLFTSDGDKIYSSTTGQPAINPTTEERTLTNAAAYLTTGVNTIAVHLMNATIGSSDLVFNLELSVPGTGASPPTPGAQNTVFFANAPPQMRQLTQSVQQPTSGQDVLITMKVTDPNGVQSVNLDYQLVNPGSYIRITDAAYSTSWTTLAMRDDGTNGDAVAGDDVFSVILPGSLQTNRRMVRYRVTATDTLGASVRGPYADDPQPNFAYFVYDGMPNYNASLRPGVLPNVNYQGGVLDELATYTLIANATDVQNSQYNSSFNEVPFRGTFVYDGVVYDHIEFRNRGQASTYQVGKNKWKIEFLNGHDLAARDDYGRPYARLLDEINILPGTNPWWRNNVATEGTVLFEPVAFKLYELAGTPAPNTNYFQFNVIDAASQTGANQYAGDFWGLYISIEQPDGSFLDERGLADGNIYNMHGGAFGNTNQRHQGSESVSDRSDLVSFLAGIDGGFETLAWWEQNLNWESYFAWNIVNHVANNSDIRPNENVNYYRNEETGLWYILPWDLDLTFEDAPHFNNPVTNRENIRSLMRDHPAGLLAYQNKLREVIDLLLANGDAARIVDEYARILTLGNTTMDILNANQAQWDYHPQKVKQGIWYKNFNPALMPSETFAGMATYMQNFLSPGGWGYNQMAGQGSDAGIPSTPTISYAGAANFPSDGLAFSTTPFNDPAAPGSFAKMEWRVAEVYTSTQAGYDNGTPFIYEIEGSWESGELTTFASQAAVPAGVVEAGKTYRARVRMQDTEGKWSHWSTPVEFVATAATEVPTLAITELNYHPGDNPAIADDEDLEFIEVTNYGSQPIDLAGIQLTTFANDPYVFAAGLSLAPGARIIVARDPIAFQSVYGTGVNLAPTGYGDSNLSNGGETIILATAGNAEIQKIIYDDAAGWPTAADGLGPSLEIIDPQGPPSDPTNWRASAMNGGSPGWDGIVGQPGDYDRNGTVDGNDFLVWQRQLGTKTPATLGADGNGDLLVDGLDLAPWSDNYGEPMIASAVVAGPVADAKTTASIDLGSWIYTGDLVGAEPKSSFGPARPRSEYRPIVRTERVEVRDAVLAAMATQVGDFDEGDGDGGDAPEQLEFDAGALDAALGELLG